MNLFLQRNKIQQIPAAFSKLCALQVLDLSHNQFTEFPEVAFDIPLLACIDLNGNQITSLPDTTEFQDKIKGILIVKGLEHISNNKKEEE